MFDVWTHQGSVSFHLTGPKTTRFRLHMKEVTSFNLLQQPDLSHDVPDPAVVSPLVVSDSTIGPTKRM